MPERVRAQSIPRSLRLLSNLGLGFRDNRQTDIPTL
jgi:hypothetical protein